MKTVSVRLPEGLHRAVKVRAAERGDSLEGIARAAFVAYLDRPFDAEGSVLERAGVSPRGLGSGEVERAEVVPSSPVGVVSGSPAAVSPVPSPGRAFRPDPKGGLAAGDPGRVGSRSRRPSRDASPAASSCPGDVPAGTRCKLCGKEH